MASAADFRRALDEGDGGSSGSRYDSALPFPESHLAMQQQQTLPPPPPPQHASDFATTEQPPPSRVPADMEEGRSGEDVVLTPGDSSSGSDDDANDPTELPNGGSLGPNPLTVLYRSHSWWFHVAIVLLFLLLFGGVAFVAVYQHQRLQQREALLEKHAITENTPASRTHDKSLTGLHPATDSTAADVTVTQQQQQSAAPSLNRFVRHFLVLQARFAPMCSASPDQNVVRNRRDGYNLDAPKEERNWSVHKRTYHTHVLDDSHDDGKLSPPRTDAQLASLPQPSQTSGEELWQNPLPFCSTPEQLLRSLRDGIRSPLDAAKFPSVSEETGFDPLKDLSFFTPFQCNFRWLSAEQICHVFSAFAAVQMEGDSLVRHTIEGLLMLLTSDLQYGGFARGQTPAHLFHLCKCDGAFSELETCRPPNTFGFGTAMLPASPSSGQQHPGVGAQDPVVQSVEGGWEPSPIRGYCNREPSLVFDPSLHLRWDQNGMNTNIDQLCTNPNLQHPDPLAAAKAAAEEAGMPLPPVPTAGVPPPAVPAMDTRPIFAYLSSGTHDRTVADATLQRLDAQLQALKRLKEACAASKRKVIVLFGGQGHVTRAVAAKYPHQDDAGFRAFDARMQQLLTERFPELEVDYMHWGALSRGAPSSDGFHFLTDANLVRAQYLANYLAMKIGIIHKLKELDEDLTLDPGRRR